MFNYNAQYQKYLSYYTAEMDKQLSVLKSQSFNVLSSAIEYSINAGGKRIRPVIMLAVAQVLNVSFEDVLPFAAAIEMIHTYSLIHDDLPCMDNDDLRRGKPTNHKVFGEGQAVLAGDALLNYALEIAINECYKGQNFIDAAKILASNAGVAGMISGQSADLYAENGAVLNKELLEQIHINKTTKLFNAAFTVPSAIANGKFLKEFEQVGLKLGLIFQYTDDLLDVLGSSQNLGKSIGKDSKANKLTAVKVFGIENTKQQVIKLTQECTQILNGIGRAEFLIGLVKKMQSRIS